MRPVDVFIPDGFPAQTYVAPQGGKFERQLDEALAQPGKIVSIVGASKTGKTTLCERRFGRDQVVIPGGRIRGPEDLWMQAFDQAGGRLTQSVRVNPMEYALQALRRRRLPLVLDDFHYVDREVQREICRQIKRAAYEGVTVVILSLPHREDDPVRSNPDLSGRVYSIDLGFWTAQDLMKIGHLGFPKVGLRPSGEVLAWLAEEALTSPQIMHTLCLETCRVLGVSGEGPPRAFGLGEIDRRAVLDRAARSYVNDTVLAKLRQGPRRRGPERKVYGFSDEDRGDVYEVLTRAIALDPPRMKFGYEELRERAARLVQGEKPDLLGALNQWNEIFENPEHRPVEWDAESRELDILDPHVYFWIRYAMRRPPATRAA
ncbi:MAG TPA: hypothetical protein VNO22_04865 [Planctomycetota bacterium]|jgi:hypothetical protein|nr:hypothetical protein [Planctomycetota bacterium]